MRYNLIEEMQEDFDIRSYDFYTFFHQGEICVSPKVGLDLPSFFIPFNYKSHIVSLC